MIANVDWKPPFWIKISKGTDIFSAQVLSWRKIHRESCCYRRVHTCAGRTCIISCLGWKTRADLLISLAFLVFSKEIKESLNTLTHKMPKSFWPFFATSHFTDVVLQIWTECTWCHLGATCRCGNNSWSRERTCQLYHRQLCWGWRVQVHLPRNNWLCCPRGPAVCECHGTLRQARHCRSHYPLASSVSQKQQQGHRKWRILGVWHSGDCHLFRSHVGNASGPHLA